MKQCFGYFAEENIELPTEVKNAIEDVFLENDNIEGVECYHKEDLEQFQQDLTLTNFVSMSIKGNNNGETNNVWTYYGNVTYSLSEAIILVDENDEVLEEISKLENPEQTILETPDDYAVVLLERVSWESENEIITREPVLFIYCPEPGEALSAEEERYQQVYNDLKNEMEM